MWIIHVDYIRNAIKHEYRCYSNDPSVYAKEYLVVIFPMWSKCPSLRCPTMLWQWDLYGAVGVKNSGCQFCGILPTCLLSDCRHDWNLRVGNMITSIYIYISRLQIKTNFIKIHWLWLTLLYDHLLHSWGLHYKFVYDTLRVICHKYIFKWESKNILWIQEHKGSKCLGMTINIQELHFSVNSTEKVLQKTVFKGTHSVCTWKF